MDEVLKHRLVGALVLVALALLVSFLLPGPDAPRREDGVQRVTIDLRVPPEPAVASPPDRAAAEETPAVVSAEPPQPAAPAPAPAPAQALVAEAEDRPGEPQIVHDEADVAPPPQAPARATASAPAKTPVLPAAPAAADPPAPPPREVTTLKLETQLASVAGADHWMVQIGSFSDIGNARQVQDRLESGGFPSIISPAETAGGTLYRVRVGPYRGRVAAGEARERVLQLGYPQAAIIRP